LSGNLFLEMHAYKIQSEVRDEQGVTIIPATRDAEIRRIVVGGQLRQKVSKTPSQQPSQ
jgi:hypothetical protein